ncbi:hypothetical protein PAXINDRAFT_16432 [Paxillus involutus ATCC 200175]|uniref:Uncharacterized protein n=1 Tax=Paxillus involutus ATCC 200175 TaxID=664439 RepID=A0A0C9TS11_PAXIN|nr:hypothetical protein PAXINDRAFT_16432 [Paxillus involutus ATCC 200175]
MPMKSYDPESRVRVVQDKLAISEAKKQEKLQLAAAKQTEKAKLVAARKAKATQAKLSDNNIEQASYWIREYGKELITLYGSAVIKPNHYYATHVGACSCNFGPLHDFWTFLYEQLNKVLKSFKMNNHANGELETTFFHEFQRTCEVGRLTYALQHYPPRSLPFLASKVMLKTSKEEQGTVTGLVMLCEGLDNMSNDEYMFQNLLSSSPDNLLPASPSSSPLLL